MTAPSAPWSHLYSDLKIQIPGLLDSVMAQVTFSLWKDFCDKTNIWTEIVPIQIVPSVNTYAFSVTSGAPNRLLMLYDPAAATPYPHWAQGSVTMQVPGIITIYYSPSTAAPWAAIVAKTPLDPVDAEGYPVLPATDQWIVDKYREALMYGILARLQAMPGKPYSNDKAAAKNNQTYISERGKARTDAIKANVFGGQRWTFPQGFATIQRGGWA